MEDYSLKNFLIEVYQTIEFKEILFTNHVNIRILWFVSH